MNDPMKTMKDAYRAGEQVNYTHAGKSKGEQILRGAGAGALVGLKAGGLMALRTIVQMLFRVR